MLNGSCRVMRGLPMLVATLVVGTPALSGSQYDKPRAFVEDLIAVPAPVPVKEGLAALPNGAKLWYWDTGGKGDVIVLAHPLSGNHESWMYQQPVFSKAGHRVIAYSRRSYYKSEAGPADDIGTQADDLALLMDQLGVSKAHVVGVAAGGSTALDFALSYPKRTISAVIVSSLMSIKEEDVREALERARGNWFEALDWEHQELSASFRAVYPGGVTLWKNVLSKNPHWEELLSQPTKTKITWDVLAKNKVPLLLATGGADIYMPPEILERIAERVATSETYFFDRAGHPVFAEYPAEFNRVILDFIAKH